MIYWGRTSDFVFEPDLAAIGKCAKVMTANMKRHFGEIKNVKFKLTSWFNGEYALVMTFDPVNAERSVR